MDDPDGTLLLRSTQPLGDYPVSIAHSLRARAERHPGHPLVAERSASGGWRSVSYGEAVAAADAIGQGLLDRGLGPDRSLLILSGNSVNHLPMTLGALTAGVPVAPVSVAYSLQSKDHARVRAISGLIAPGAVYADDAAAFEAALDAALAPVPAAAGGAAPAIIAAGQRSGAIPLAGLLATAPGDAVRAAFAALTSDAIAKILFTSGSTGSPKGVLNTHRMLSANQQMIRQAWPFLDGERPVIVDWLPWSHTFGGNHNVNMTITNGGTLYVDGGRPAPGLFGQTIANLTDVPPTIYFNVPAGYAQLVPALEADPEFAQRFFSRLRLLFNAAAALPAALRERLETLAARYAPDRDIPVTGSWGATETAPAVTSANFPFTDAQCIGAPLPGGTVKLVPAEDAYEIRVQGPNVTPATTPAATAPPSASIAPASITRRSTATASTGPATWWRSPSPATPTPAWSSAAGSPRTSSWKPARSSASARSAPLCCRRSRPRRRRPRGREPRLRLRPRLAQPRRSPQASRP